MPGGFVFRLETVRQIRQRAVDEQRKVVAEAVRGVTAVDERIKDLTAEREEATSGMRTAQGDRRISVPALCSFETQRVWLSGAIHRMHAERAKRQAILDKQRRKLGELSKRVKVIEKLRERQWNRYIARIRKAEQAASDEAATQMYMRRLAGGAAEGANGQAAPTKEGAIA